jgi:hypothetical protein
MGFLPEIVWGIGYQRLIGFPLLTNLVTSKTYGISGTMGFEGYGL